jgi:uncharacterized protein YjiS (DUF1127 family)|tara:strand:+ start:169 stop:429 length:261 start_codon:yes stop_codon:yes gene_type:complete
MTQAIMTVSHLLQDALEGLVDLVRQWRRNRARKAMIATTRRELRNLTDHELRDLGIGRSDIESIARGTFNDNRMTARTNKNLRGWV